MKSFLYKISSSLLAFLMFLSTMSFTVNKHFCGDFLVDQAVFSEAHSCGMEHSSQEMLGTNKCKDQQISVKGQKELQNSFSDLELQQQVFLASFTYSYLDLFEEFPEKKISFSNYYPPLLVYDIQLLDETFLI